MISILDFDYTIFDADRFKRIGLAKLSSLDGDSFLDYYKARFKERGLNYAPQVQIEELGLGHAATVEKFEELAQLLSHLDDYLYPETAALLASLRKISTKIILATHGEPDWQKQKVSCLKISGQPIEQFFDEIIFEGGKKVDNTQLLKFKGQPLRLVNDNARESLELIDVLGGQAELFLLAGPYAHNVEHKFRVYSRPELVAEFKKIN